MSLGWIQTMTWCILGTKSTVVPGGPWFRWVELGEGPYLIPLSVASLSYLPPGPRATLRMRPFFPLVAPQFLVRTLNVDVHAGIEPVLGGGDTQMTQS